WPLGLGHAGLTLATSVGACINATALFWLLRGRGYYAPTGGWSRFVGKLAIALVILGLVLAYLAGAPETWLQTGLWGRIGRLAVIVIAGAVAYFATLFTLGFWL